MNKITIKIDGKPVEFIGYEMKPHTVKQGERPLVPPQEKEVIWSKLILFTETHAMEFDVSGNVESYGPPYKIETYPDRARTRILFFKTMPYKVTERTNEIAYTIEHHDPKKRNVYKEIYHEKDDHTFTAYAKLPRLIRLVERQQLGIAQPAQDAAATTGEKKNKAGPGRKKGYDQTVLKRAADMRKQGLPVKDIAREMKQKPREIAKMLDAHRHREQRLEKRQ